ncbi:hypothetical protein Trydic_g14305 [Trypoxylus dichotomus]
MCAPSITMNARFVSPGWSGSNIDSDPACYVTVTATIRTGLNRKEAMRCFSDQSNSRRNPRDENDDGKGTELFKPKSRMLSPAIAIVIWNGAEVVSPSEHPRWRRSGVRRSSVTMAPISNDRGRPWDYGKPSPIAQFDYDVELKRTTGHF